MSINKEEVLADFQVNNIYNTDFMEGALLMLMTHFLVKINFFKICNTYLCF